MLVYGVIHRWYLACFTVDLVLSGLWSRAHVQDDGSRNKDRRQLRGSGFEQEEEDPKSKFLGGL